MVTAILKYQNGIATHKKGYTIPHATIFGSTSFEISLVFYVFVI